MRKRITLLLLLMTISLTGCSNTSPEVSNENNKTINDIKVPEQETVTIKDESIKTKKEDISENFEQYITKIYVKNEYIEVPDGMFILLNPETGETYQADQKTYYVLNGINYEYTPLYANEIGQYIPIEDIKYYIISTGLDDNENYYNVIIEDKYSMYLYSTGN